mgnify:CR=1 FL=1
MNCRPEDMLLYAVTDRAWLNGETLESQVEKALKGGATFVQLREKELDEEMFVACNRIDTSYQYHHKTNA